MKKLILMTAIVMSGIIYNTANAQIRVHVGVRLGLPNVYVPARVVVAAPAPVAYNEPANYDGDEDYYYLPDVDAYYSVPDQCYYYNNGNAWVSATYLPGAYRDYDWRSARHYEVHAPRPYLHNDIYRARFNGVAFNGRWNDRVSDNRNHQMGYSRDRVAYNRSNFERGNNNRQNLERSNNNRDNSRGREKSDRGDFRHVR